MKKATLTLGLFLTLIFAAGTVNANHPLVGAWSFNITQAPWEYSRGIMTIELNEEKAPVGKLAFQSGYEVRINRITEKEKKYTLEIWIEGYTIRTILEIKEGALTGHTETPDGNIPFSAKRYVPEK